VRLAALVDRRAGLLHLLKRGVCLERDDRLADPEAPVVRSRRMDVHYDAGIRQALGLLCVFDHADGFEHAACGVAITVSKSIAPSRHENSGRSVETNPNDPDANARAG